MKKIIVGLFAILLIFSMTGCKKDKTPDDGKIDPPEEPVKPVDSPYETPEGYPYPKTIFNDGKNREIQTMTIVDNGNNVVYLGDKFTAKGYDVYMIYLEMSHIGTDLPLRTATKIEDFTFDDSRVNYQKEGTYSVTFYGRVETEFRTVASSINVKADRYEYLGEKHLFGIKCASEFTSNVGITLDQIRPQDVYLIYTENKYDTFGELVTEEVFTRNDYTVDTDSVDTTKAGSYPVYVECSKTYGDVTITVKTFFILTLEA
ncbi:MAG: hypothetical protein K2I77_06020 [Anaeroplasmataceae bacterium]|nr:hypothetical protein [Anaeroplasmataceae bacterium]